MLHHDTNISRLMVYSQQIEDSKHSMMNPDGIKRARSDKSGQPKSKKRFCNQYFSMGNKDGVSDRISQGGRGGGFTFKRTRRITCGK